MCRIKLRNIYLLTFTLLSTVLMLFCSSDAKITGNCANCHTMHNSQNGTHMILYLAPGETDTNPKQLLLRGTCLGCHGRNTGSNIDPTTGAPQVLHTGTDLAAGNFRYLSSSDNRGHNVIDTGNQEDIAAMFPPPGFPRTPSNHVTLSLSKTNFTCAGVYGCHGSRSLSGGSPVPGGLSALKGAHHKNVAGKCDNPTENYNSYRFLRGVKGLENTGWQNESSSSHNEYFGATTPMDGLGGGPGPPDQPITCSGRCHQSYPTGTIGPASNTISGFCATCHGYFHSVWGIGGDTSSPFTRHPTDVTLPNSGEYSAYTTYSVEAPVARAGTVPDSPSPNVNPGTDNAIVMCLSCHAAHGTNYPDILKWDYSTMIAGGSGSGGCFTCHTQKK